jgi:hypothetical protein
MITSNTSSTRSAACRTALIALGFACSFAIVLLPALRAADSAAVPQADKAPTLPLTSTFEKGTAGEKGGPYVLKLTNTSKDSLKVTAKILLSVAFHMGSKHWDLPEHAIDPGQGWSISDLSAGDKITLTAKGFAPLELVVP